MKKIFSPLVLVLVMISVYAQPCADVFISEYVEGSASNKALELFNPTSSQIDLNGYKLLLFSNGAVTPTVTLNLGNTIAAGDVYVVVNSQANAAIQAVRDTTSGVTGFNGDDAVVLMKNTDTLDIIGVVGVDPGAQWTVGTGSTANHTLIRKSSVHEGTTDWSTAAADWDILPSDSIGLGAHTMNSCVVPLDTAISFSSGAANVNENAGTYSVNLILNQTASTDKSIDVELLSGDPADIGNYSTQTLIVTANSNSKNFTITITNDATTESNEQFVFALRNPSSGLLVDSDSLFTLTILANDSVSTGIGNQNRTSDFTVYPNPNHGVFSIYLNKPNENATIRVSNVTGQIVYATSNFLGTANPVDVDLNGVSSEIYFVEVSTGASVSRTKVCIGF